MSVTTLVAAGISVRHGAVFTAVLGLLGGLATPVLLSQNSNNALGLFLYLAVLNTGFLWVARRQNWAFITGDRPRRHQPDGVRLDGDAARTRSTLPIAVGGFAVLGAIYMWHALETADDDDAATSHVLGLLGGMLPLALSIVLAADRRFVEQWPWVLGNLGILAGRVDRARRDAAPPARPGLRRRRRRSPARSGRSTSASVDVAGRADDGGAAADRRLQRASAGCGPIRRESDGTRPTLSVLGGAGLIVACGLGAVRAQPPRPDHAAAPASSSASSRCSSWSASSAARSTSRRSCCRPAAAVDRRPGPPLVRARGRRRASTSACSPSPTSSPSPTPSSRSSAIALGVDDDAPWLLRADIATLVAVAVAYTGLHGAIARSAFSAPTPLFALLGLDVALVLLVAIRRAWTSLVPLAALGGVAVRRRRGTRSTSRPRPARVAVVAEIAIYLLFVALPFVLTAVAAGGVAPGRGRLAHLGADRAG